MGSYRRDPAVLSSAAAERPPLGDVFLLGHPALRAVCAPCGGDDLARGTPRRQAAHRRLHKHRRAAGRHRAATGRCAGLGSDTAVREGQGMIDLSLSLFDVMATTLLPSAHFCHLYIFAISNFLHQHQLMIEKSYSLFVSDHKTVAIENCLHSS